MTTPLHLVIDSSYLVEFLRIPGRHDEDFARKVFQRFFTANEKKARIYIPLAVVIEVANHIAHISDGAKRKEFSDRFALDVTVSIKESKPWIITPLDTNSIPLDKEQFINMIESFRNYSSSGMGMSDTMIILEAKRIKKRYGNMAHVHIWTRDQAIKPHEPDRELDPLF